MKYLILLSTLIAFSTHAWEPIQPYGGQYLSNEEALYSVYPYTGQYSPYRIDTYQPKLRPQVPIITDSMPNIWGGEDFYGPSGFVGETQRNIHGGRDFYWSPTLRY